VVGQKRNNVARKLTKKQRGFVNTYADTGNATLAAKENYDVSDDNTAGVLGHENLSKPKIQEALKELGFDSNNAKRVVATILNDESEEATARLNAADKVFKVNSDYAPEKTLNVNVEVLPSEDIKQFADALLHEQRNHRGN